MKCFRAALVVSGLLAAIMPANASRGSFQVVPDPVNTLRYVVLRDGQAVFRIGIVGWGPDRGWIPVESRATASAGAVAATVPLQLGGDVALRFESRLENSRTLLLRYVFKSAVDTALTGIAVTIGAPEGHGVSIRVKSEGGVKAVSVPSGPGAYGVSGDLELKGAVGTASPVVIRIDPPVNIAADGDLRIMAVEKTIRAGETIRSIRVVFPADAELRASREDVARLTPVVPGPDWFAWATGWNAANGTIGLEAWLDAPAGLHGGVRAKGDRYVFEDGTSARFWGVNVQYADCAPAKGDADFTASRYADLGINAVRLHKFTGPGWEGIGDPGDATRMTDAGYDRFDYFTARLREKGIYYGFSHTFKYVIRAAQKNRVAGYAELMRRGGSTYAVINWAEDVQDLLIETVTNILRHRNPYTGLVYAEDPALAFVECQNEDDIFFFTTTRAYQEFPTYRRLLEKRYSGWLAAKYGDRAGLSAAWGGALAAGEKLELSNIAVQPNPWFMGSDHLPKLRGGERRRMLDNAAFLHEVQNGYYAKFRKAIRAAGYRGPLIASAWQAPGMLPHYYNLRSDYLCGPIDRHEYFGSRLSDTMLHAAGSGLVSAGLQQVADRPFGLSEWITVYPALRSVEGPLLVAAYGMGLQGWDSSYLFCSVSRHPDGLVGKPPWGLWRADTPNQLGMYPVLSRMVLRGDVREAPVISVRRVRPDNLLTGGFDFSDQAVRRGDGNASYGSVPATALAIGRCVVEFTDSDQPSVITGFSGYRSGKTVRSVTGQLEWDEENGIVTVNTPGSQGYVGFAAGRTLALRDVSITPATPYAMVLVTAAGRTESLSNATRAILGVAARNANTGMRVSTLDGRTIADNGSSPILIEPVHARIAFAGRRVASVEALGHDGSSTGRYLEVKDGAFTVDGKRDRALYYEIRFGK